MYPLFLTGSFIYGFYILFDVIEILLKFIEYIYNQCLKLCTSPFCLVLFLEFCSVLSFGHVSLSPYFGSLPVFVSMY